jgi:cob(I)alamin adenosyltransferase
MNQKHNEEEFEELTATGRARIREELAAMEARQRPGRVGLTIVYTGDGKGKTTAALGVVLRARGQHMRVAMLQFLKSQTTTGEIQAAQQLGVEILPLGQGGIWESADPQQDRPLAQACWQQCRAKIESQQYDVIILDEMTYALNYTWIDIEEVLTVLRNRDPQLHIIITGRNAPPALIEYADLVTEMREIKHPYKTQGILEQRGIDF